MSGEQTQNKIYFNANICLRQGIRAVSSLDQGNPATGLLILRECLLVPPLVRDLQRKVMVDGAAHHRGCLLVNRVDANRRDILHYWSTFLHRHHRNHLKLCSAGISQGFGHGRRLRPQRRWPRAFLNAWVTVWRRRSANGAPPTCWGRFRWQAQ